MPGEKSFTTTEDDLVAGNRLHVRQLWNRRAILNGWLLAVAVIGLLWIQFCDRFDWSLLWVPLAAAAWLPIGWLVAQATFTRAGRQAFRQLKPFLRPTMVAWDENSIRFTSSRGESRDDWGNYYAWAADDRSVVLYQSAHLFVTLPVRDIGPDARDDIVSLFKQAGVKERQAR